MSFVLLCYVHVRVFLSVCASVAYQILAVISSEFCVFVIADDFLFSLACVLLFGFDVDFNV